MSKKIIILGQNGYFGNHFKDYFLHLGWEIYNDKIDILDSVTIKNTLEKFQPDVVLNCAGITGKPNIDWCESHKIETANVNITGAINVATIATKLGIYTAHLGSGCVYQGDNNGKGFSENDNPNFYGSFYSATKAVSERALDDLNILQLRIRLPIEGKSNPKNAIDKLKNYEKIISVPNSVTIVEDFIPASYKLIEKREKGIFNMTNIGSIDHEYLMTKYKEIVDPSYNFTVMSVEEMLEKYAKAQRSNCILTTDKREALGIHMPPIESRIIEILKEYKTSLSI